MREEPSSKQQAAIVEQLLNDYPADEAYAELHILDGIPTYIDVWQQDQLEAAQRDGATVFVAVIVREGLPE